MTRVENILLRARDTLADHQKTRWSDDRLIRLINEAQLDICRRAKLLRKTTELHLSTNRLYKLPDDLLLIDRVVLNGEALPFLSHLDLDRRLVDWEIKSGEIEAVVYDKHNRRELKFYPQYYDEGSEYSFINSGFYEHKECISDDFGLIVSIISPSCECTEFSGDFGFSSLCSTAVLTSALNEFGVVSNLDDYTIVNDFGITNISVENGAVEPVDFGVLSGMNDLDNVATVYYIKRPSEISSTNDAIEIDEIFDSTIKYYITGKALRDDIDTQNRVVGNEELAFYDRDLKEAIKDDELDFTRNSNKQYIARYKGAFDG